MPDQGRRGRANRARQISTLGCLSRLAFQARTASKPPRGPDQVCTDTHVGKNLIRHRIRGTTRHRWGTHIEAVPRDTATGRAGSRPLGEPGLRSLSLIDDLVGIIAVSLIGTWVCGITRIFPEICNSYCLVQDFQRLVNKTLPSAFLCRHLTIQRAAT